MGTNFYFKEDECDSCGHRPEQTHIGKRSSAGPYCWDCDKSLCKEGVEGVHTGCDFLDECPSCNTPFEPYEDLSDGPVSVELGFSEPNKTKPSGVRGCSSFTWAIGPDHFDEKKEGKVVVNEYGDEMSIENFKDMLDSNCPIQIVDWVGREFS